MRRLYFEACGKFTLLSFEQPRPGLSPLPLLDAALRDEQEKAPGQVACGHVEPSPPMPATKCPRCG